MTGDFKGLIKRDVQGGGHGLLLSSICRQELGNWSSTVTDSHLSYSTCGDEDTQIWILKSAKAFNHVKSR
jgi:hypothetical protein